MPWLLDDGQPGRQPRAPERQGHHVRLRLARPAAGHHAAEEENGLDWPWDTITSDWDVDRGVNEYHGANAFFRDGDRVFRTYFVDNRGDEALGSTWSYLDLAPLGRQETWEDSPEGYPQTAPYVWWNWHDEYDHPRDGAGPDEGLVLTLGSVRFWVSNGTGWERRVDFTEDSDHRQLREASPERLRALPRRVLGRGRTRPTRSRGSSTEAMAEGGWIGIAIPAEYGGGGAGITEASIVLEEVAASGACMNGASAIHLSIFGMHPVVRHGSEPSSGSGTCRASQPATCTLRSASPSRTPALDTTAITHARQSVTVTATASPGARSGRRRRWSPTGCCCSPAPRRPRTAPSAPTG